MNEARARRDVVPVVLALLLLSACGIAFELLIAALAGYLIGESLLLLSVIVGVFLSSMGLGAHLSRRVRDPSEDAFVWIGVLLAVLGGVTPACASAWNGVLPNVGVALVIALVFCGAALGAAIPIAARLVAAHDAVPKVIAVVLAVDYLGALAGSLLVPWIVLPMGGLTRGPACAGMVALGAAALVAATRRTRLRHPSAAMAVLLLGAVALVAAAVHGPAIEQWSLSRLKGERIVYREHSPYQEILLTEDARGLNLRLNGRIQFSDAWEREYHDALVHPAFAMLPGEVRDVLVLGGGDGLALREILKHPEVRRVVLVDLDPQMVALARRHPRLTRRNRKSFEDPRVKVIAEDAFLFVRRAREQFDGIFIDLPQPVSVSLSKLYTVEFYRDVARQARPRAIIAVQSEEVEASRGKALWCIVRTLEAAGLHARPYLTGSLAYTLASHAPLDVGKMDAQKTDTLTAAMMRGLFEIPKDLGPWNVEPNRIEDHALLRYYK
jgi:spermidine synthase